MWKPAVLVTFWWWLGLQLVKNMAVWLYKACSQNCHRYRHHHHHYHHHHHHYHHHYHHHHHHHHHSFVIINVIGIVIFLFLLFCCWCCDCYYLFLFPSFQPSACSSALGMEDNHIPNQAVLSTSFHGGFYPYRGRLFSSKNWWMAATTDQNAFLQIEVGITDHVITAVATQGHKTYKIAVVKFQLSFSIDSLQWFDYREENDVRVNMWSNLRTVPIFITKIKNWTLPTL